MPCLLITKWLREYLSEPRWDKYFARQYFPLPGKTFLTPPVGSSTSPETLVFGSTNGGPESPSQSRDQRLIFIFCVCPPLPPRDHQGTRRRGVKARGCQGDVSQT
jgi:hypothetical protein